MPRSEDRSAVRPRRWKPLEHCTRWQPQDSRPEASHPSSRSNTLEFYRNRYRSDCKYATVRVAEQSQISWSLAAYAARGDRLFSSSAPKENAYFNIRMSDGSYPHCDMIQ